MDTQEKNAQIIALNIFITTSWEFFGKLCSAPKKKCPGSAGEIEALKRSCTKGFQITDNNFVDLARKSKEDSGTTACVVMLYGPDDEGSLLLITANVGDSRAVICRGSEAIALTKDHK
eukprot:Selendium_serpulae@DN10602_c0_g1_i1.p2